MMINLGTGIKIKIINLQKIQGGEDTYEKLRIRIDANDQTIMTSEKPFSLSLWNENFYYKTADLENKNIGFSLLCDGNRFGTSEITFESIKKLLKKQFKPGETINLNVYHTIYIKNEDNQMNARLNTQISTFERDDFLGAIQVPKLSIAPKSKKIIQKKQSNAIDNISLNKLNLFSCLDDDQVKEFQFFPNKFQAVNKKQEKSNMEQVKEQENIDPRAALFSQKNQTDNKIEEKPNIEKIKYDQAKEFQFPKTNETIPKKEEEKPID